MKKWIVELTHETMPARMQPQAEKAVHWLVNETLKKHELTFDYESIVVHITPHRLVVMVDVAPIIAGSGKIFLGPRVDAAPQAVDGFMRQHGITDKNKLEQQTNKKGALCYVFYKEQPQRNAIDCLPRVLEDILLNMRWQKSMRWGKGNFMWVRPLRAIESAYGEEELQGGFFLGYGTGDKATPPQYMETPHPNTELFLAFAKLADGHDYEKSLKKNGIILARDEREKSIIQQVQAIAEKHRLTPQHTNVAMMAGLSENPVMLICSLPELAKNLPNEVIGAVCDAQYGVIPLINKSKKMTHVAFLTDNASKKSHATITEGYATLLKARLADADFYMEKDQENPLKHHAKQLVRMTLHADLGNMMDKTKRMANIIRHITGKPLDENLVQLAKADLTTQMVAEFPSLQGIMGAHYYSKDSNHNRDWAQAIRDHYRPFSMEDDLPTSELGCVLALADKLDTVVGFFLAGKAPTGSKDPYGLRRAAIGIARILIERLSDYSLMRLINTSAKSSPAFERKHEENHNRAYTYNACCFINEQMRRWLVQHHDYDSRIILAILGREQEELVPVTEQLEKISFLHDFHTSKHKDDFINVYERVCHFAKSLIKKGYAPKECREKTEQTLYDHWQQAIKAPDFTHRLRGLAELHKPLEIFCSTVKVFDDDYGVKRNRIALMDDIKKSFDETCKMKWLVNPTLSPTLWSR